MDSADYGADSHLVDDQVIGHYSYTENLDIHDQDLYLGYNNIIEIIRFPLKVCPFIYTEMFNGFS